MPLSFSIFHIFAISPTPQPSSVTLRRSTTLRRRCVVQRPAAGPDVFCRFTQSSRSSMHHFAKSASPRFTASMYARRCDMKFCPAKPISSIQNVRRMPRLSFGSRSRSASVSFFSSGVIHAGRLILFVRAV